MSLEKIASKIKLLALDFDGVLTDNRVFINGQGEESVVCSRSDGHGIVHIARPAGIEVIVISLEKSPVVKKRCEKLGVECFSGVEDKLAVLKKFCSEKDIPLGEVCFIGNDLSDISSIKSSGLGVAVADGEPEVLKAADFVTKKKGGNGAIREICKLLVKHREV